MEISCCCVPIIAMNILLFTLVLMGVSAMRGFPVQLFDTTTYVDGTEAMTGKAPSLSTYLGPAAPSTDLQTQTTSVPVQVPTFLPPIVYRDTNITLDTKTMPLDWADSWSASVPYQFNEDDEPVSENNFVPDITKAMIHDLMTATGGVGVLATALASSLYRMVPTPSYTSSSSQSSSKTPSFVNNDFAKKYGSIR